MEKAVVVAQQLNIPLVSWDKEQLRKASSILTTYAPDRYP
jgi:predicted nucleic acid-binding protein